MTEEKITLREVSEIAIANLEKAERDRKEEVESDYVKHVLSLDDDKPKDPAQAIAEEYLSKLNGAIDSHREAGKGINDTGIMWRLSAYEDCKKAFTDIIEKHGVKLEK